MAAPILSGVVKYVVDGLPRRIEVQQHDMPLDLRPGETAEWVVGELSLEASRRVRDFLLRLVVIWNGSKPDWLESHVLGRSVDSQGRPVLCLDGGDRRHYSSLRSASRAEGIDRTLLRRRLADRRPDTRGRLWMDAPQPRPETYSATTASA